MTPPAPTRDTLYYDGACGLCTRSTRVLRALDWFRRLRFLDMTRIPDEDLPVERAAALRGIPMLTRTGRTLVGFPALRRALLQTPLACLPALLLYLPGLSHLAGRIYRHIAENRARTLAPAACEDNPGAPSTDPGQTG